MRPIVLLALLLSPSVLPAQVPTRADSSLASELHARVQLDQAARQLITMRNQPGKQMAPEDIRLITTVDSLNTAWLKRLAAVGLPPLQEYLAQIKQFYGRSQ